MSDSPQTVPARTISQQASAILMATAILAVGVAITFYGERSYSAQKLKEIETQAEILAAQVPAALSFDDLAAAQSYVNAYRSNPEIIAAGIYDERGALFAGFSVDADAQLPSRLDLVEEGFTGNRAFASARVELAGAQLGTVTLTTIVDPFWRRVSRYGGITLLFMMAALFAGILAIANRALGEANAALKRRADELQEANARLVRESAEREKAEAQLRQSQKMETIGHLTGGIAHDFNNLLTIISGNLERLRRRIAEGGPAADIEAALDAAHNGATRAAKLTKSLLAFARRQPLKFETVDFNALVSDISALLRRTLGESIDIEFVRGAGLWKASVDANQLENAIINLAVNARDAMPEGGKLTIETANTFLDEKYAEKEGDVRPGQYVALCVTDTGPGIAPEMMQHVFEPFFTTKGVGHGTGLGLAQVYGFVKQSDGHIKLYSEPGEGLTVKMYFPRAAAAAETIPAKAPQPAKIAAGGWGKKVLVVEDEPDVRRHTVDAVEELGYRALEAGDGAEALRVLAEHQDIDLLFTDVGLPGGMTGRELADAATGRHPKLKVLYTTGYARNAIVHNNRLDPGVRLLTKPFSFDDLARALADAVAANGKTVLIVEDEFLIRDLTASHLKELGYDTVEAGAADAAMKIAEREGADLFAAVVDIGLPDRRGDVLAGELRALLPTLRLVIASGSADSEVRAKFAKDAGVAFLNKPFDKDGLRRALGEI